LARLFGWGSGASSHKTGARKASAPHHIMSAQGIDLDSLEVLMDRRLSSILRHTWLVTFLTLFLLAALIAGAVYWVVEPTVMRVAVGPRDGEDVRLIGTLAEKLRRDRAAIRLSPVMMDGPVRVTDITSKPDYDLAVVASGPHLSADWPVVAILWQNSLALMVPDAGARDAKKTPKKAKPVKIEKITDLSGRRVGIVMGGDAGRDVLNLLLGHYGVAPDKVEIVNVEVGKLKAAIQDNLIDAVLVIGPPTGRLMAESVAAATFNKKGPKFLDVDHADAIAKRVPAFASAEIDPGMFGGSPAIPADTVTTLSFPQYLVARKTLSESQIATFTALLYKSRQVLAHDWPGIVKIEAPSTDKDAAALVHPGTSAYLDDNQKTFFDKYNDAIFYGMLIIPGIGSAIAAAASYMSTSRRSRRVQLLHRLLQLMKKARGTDALATLDQIEAEADGIVVATIELSEREQLDETGFRSFSLAIEQTRQAIAGRRSELLAQREPLAGGMQLVK